MGARALRLGDLRFRLLEGSNYPAEYEDAFFFADSVRGCIYVMLADDDGEPDPETARPFLYEGTGYPGVDLQQGPEGSIYYNDLYEGKIDKIAYDPGAPTARLKTVGDPWGAVPLKVKFDAGASTGPAGDPLGYKWDLNGDGKFEEGSNAPTQEFTYADGSKNVVAAVRVEDTVTLKSSVARLTVYPGDSPPKVTITQPSPTSPGASDSRFISPERRSPKKVRGNRSRKKTITGRRAFSTARSHPRVATNTRCRSFRGSPKA